MGGVEGGGDAVGVGGGGAVFGVHVCELGLDELVVCDGGGELGAGVGVGEGESEGGGHDAGGMVSLDVYDSIGDE